ncbi:unnamed protein product [Amoebophrya sp. A120]|nr:unnamed protein product [Amoebophrya sp. A120]|eukprot:GSA120T00004314001.1
MPTGRALTKRSSPRLGGAGWLSSATWSFHREASSSSGRASVASMWTVMPRMQTRTSGCKVVLTSTEFAAASSLVRQKRCFAYSDTSDRRLAIRERKGLEILDFFSENADIDFATMQEAIRGLASSNHQNPQHMNEIATDERFRLLLAKVKDKVDNAALIDARSLAQLADALAKLRFNTPELEDLVQSLATTIRQRENAFSPRYLAQLALALSSRKVHDVELIEFVRQETMKVVQDIEPAHAVGLLEAFRRWGFFDREMHDMIVERMTDEVDRFSSRDIVDALKVLSDLGLVRGFLLRRLAQLAFENLHVFTPKQLVGMLYSLSRLRFLVKLNVEDVLDHLRQEIDQNQLSAAENAKLFFSLSMLQPEYDDTELVKLLGTRFLDTHRTQTIYMIHMIDVAWGVCRFKHLFDKDMYSVRIRDLIDRLMAMPAPKNRVLLAKSHEILLSLQFEHWEIFAGAGAPGRGEQDKKTSDEKKHKQQSSTSTTPASSSSSSSKVQLSKQWQIACEDADSVAQSKNESSRLQAELLLKLEHTFHKQKIQLQQNVGLSMATATEQGRRKAAEIGTANVIGSLRADLTDEKTKLVIDLDAPNRPINRTVKHRILNNLGFHPVSLSYWRWRQCKSDEEQSELLEANIGPLLGKLLEEGVVPGAGDATGRAPS